MEVTLCHLGALNLEDENRENENKRFLKIKNKT